MAGPTERILIRFEGDGTGVEELTWGQLHLWLGMSRRGTWMPIRVVRPVPAGTTIDQIASELRFVLSRHPSLRTTLRFGYDDGLPRQVVAGAGALPMEIFDAADDAASLAGEVERRYAETDFDFAKDWPVRSAVVRHRGRPTHQVLLVCHLAIDGEGWRAMAADLAARDPATGTAAGPVTATPPLALARWQRTAAARRQSRATVRYTEQVLRTMPARRLGESTDPRRPRYWELGFRSTAMHLAAQAIAARCGAENTAVALTLWVVALGRVTGVNPVVTRVLVGNRFRRQLADAVTTVVQDGILLVDLAGATFEEALVRTRLRAVSAYKYGCYDPRDLRGVEARISRERGEPVEVGAFFNDRRPAGTASAPAASADQIRAALPLTTLWCVRQQDAVPHEPLFLHINDVPDTLELRLLADTHRASPGEAEALLRGMESLAVAAARDPAMRPG